jgi:hypothetical protein
MNQQKSFRSDWFHWRETDSLQWKLSYFIISSSQLSYYETENCQKCHGIIPINSMTSVHIVEGNKENPHQLLIQHHGISILIALVTDEIRLLWMDAIVSVKLLQQQSLNDVDDHTERNQWISHLSLHTHHRNLSPTLSQKLSLENDCQTTKSLVKIFLRDWIRKQGSKVKSWKLRWFILTEDSINYYTEEDHINLRGHIFLRSDTILRLIDEPLFCLEIISRNRHLLLSFSSNELRTKWKYILDMIIEIKLNQNDTHKMSCRKILDPYISYLEDWNENLLIKTEEESITSSSSSFTSFLSSDWIKGQLAASHRGRKVNIDHEDEMEDDDHEISSDSENEGNFVRVYSQKLLPSSFKPILHFFRDPSRHLSSTVKAKAIFTQFTSAATVGACLLIFSIINMMIARLGIARS